MVRKTGFTFLFILLTVAGSVASAAELAEIIWWKLEGKKTRSLSLCYGKFPFTGGKKTLSQSAIINNANVWIRNPNSAVSRASLHLKKDTIALNLPAELNGLYIASVHLDAGVMDFDSNGTNERVHLYSNCFLYHRKQGGMESNKLDVFFRNPDNIVLEIGPLITKGKSGKMSYIEAGNQKALKKYKMGVLYKDQPLEDAEVTILTEGGWNKRVRTDDQGTFSIIPHESKQKEEKYLYVVVHKEPLEGEYNGVKYISEYHCATLMMTVQKPPPEWQSKSSAFALWVILGTGSLIILIVGTIYHRRRMDSETMVRFEQHRINPEKVST